MKKILDFSEIDWGPDDAKGDPNLRSYFVKIPDYDDIINGKRRYIIGRKGTGKTAICERIRIEADEDALTFERSISLRNFPLQLVRDLRDKSQRDKSQFVPVWAFLIATELARIVIADQGVQPSSVKNELLDFLRSNFPEDEIGFGDTLSLLSERASQIEVNHSWLRGSQINKDSQTKQATIHYQKATDLLLKKLGQIRTESRYYLILDELDEGYRAGDSRLGLMLLSLLRAVEETAIQLGGEKSPFRPLLVLRSDIFDALEDSDLNKLDDSTIRLRWHASETAHWSLREIVNARISASLPIPGVKDPWEFLTDSSDKKMNHHSTNLWSFITSRTMERPRDIIKFLKICGKVGKGKNQKLTYPIAQEAENDYSRWLYNELGDEIHSHLPVWKEALNCITRIGKGVLTTDELRKELEAHEKVASYIKDNGASTDSIIRQLFDFGIIGNRNSGNRWFFKYKDNDLNWDSRMGIIVHWGFHKKLRIRPGD